MNSLLEKFLFIFLCVTKFLFLFLFLKFFKDYKMVSFFAMLINWQWSTLNRVVDTFVET